MKSKAKTKKGFVRKALGVAWWAVVLALAILLFSIVGAKFRGEVPRVFGYSVMQIVSGSMEPEIEVGAYILVRECNPEEIGKNDIISFYSDDSSIYGFPNTHRVVEEPVKTENGYEYVTKGDANTVADEVTAKSGKLIGKYVCTLDFLNSFVSLLDGGLMIILLISLQIGTVIIVVASVLTKRNDEAYEDSEDK